VGDVEGGAVAVGESLGSVPRSVGRSEGKIVAVGSKEGVEMEALVGRKEGTSDGIAEGHVRW
jgi:hypothetical protein